MLWVNTERSWLNQSMQEYVALCNMETSIVQREDLRAGFRVTWTEEGTLIVQGADSTITGKSLTLPAPHHCLQIRLVAHDLYNYHSNEMK